MSYEKCIWRQEVGTSRTFVKFVNYCGIMVAEFEDKQFDSYSRSRIATRLLDKLFQIDILILSRIGE